MNPLLASATVVALATFSLQLHLSAANASWTVATGGDFATDSNWSTAASPGNTTSGATVNTDIATFSNIAGGTVTIDAGRTLRGFNISSNVSAYTFTGGTMYLSSNGGTTNGGAIQMLNPGVTTATQTIDMPIVVAAVGGNPIGLAISNRTSGSGLLNLTSTATISSIASGPINVLLQGDNTGNNTIAGVISDGSGTSTIGIRKDNLGTWILTGANTYTGGTVAVNGGKLFINGNQSAATGNVVVGSATTLGGVGTIGGATTMNGGSFLVAGASANTVGTLSFASTLNMGGTTATLEVGGSVAGQFDRIDVAGALTYNGNVQIVDFNGYDTSAQSAEYQLFGIGASQSGNLVSLTVDSVALTRNLGVWTATAGNVSYSFDQGTGRLAVTVSSGTAFENWIATNYPQIPNGSNGPNDDADKDGATNFVEFAVAGNPASGSDMIQLHVLKADSEQVAKLVLTIAVRAGTPAFSTDDSPVASHDGILYAISGSLDLQSFATKVNPIAPVVPVEMPAAKPGYEYRSFSLEGSEGLPGQGFIRASVLETTN